MEIGIGKGRDERLQEGEQKGEMKGKEEGRKEGKEEGKRKWPEQRWPKGLDIGLVAEISGLSEREIIRLKEELRNNP